MGYPLYEAFYNSFQDNRILQSSRPVLDRLREKFGDEFLTLSEETLGVAEKMSWNCEEIFTRYIIDFLKEQIYFLKHGEYGHGTFEEIRAAVYDNEEVMLESYMPGLFLAYSFTSLMFEKYHFFKTHFLSRLTSGDRVMELGFGDGFYIWTLLKHNVAGTIAGVDISSTALAFATNLLEKAGVMDSRVDLGVGNIIEGLPVTDTSFDRVILSEVIEHIPSPIVGIREARRLLVPGGTMFLSTVYDSNHMDHMVNFKNSAEVEALIRECGFAIEESMLYRVADEFPGIRDKSVGLAYVCRAI